MRKMIVYPNYSMGGVTSVIRGRAAAEPDTQFDVIFLKERGGSGAFDDYGNVHVRVCNEAKVESLLEYRLNQVHYDDIAILSQPMIANRVAERPEAVVTYEFHSSDLSIIRSEIGKLDLNNLAQIAAPSQFMVEQIMPLIPNRYKPRVRVIPNRVDSKVFSSEGPANFLESFSDITSEAVPLVWIGRFDAGKGYRYFLRLLAKLPAQYVGLLVVSLEDDPQRVTEFLAEANAMRVMHRVRIFSNLSRPSIAELYRSVREQEGWFVSTSLMESFGYSVVEALTCGLRVAAFELPAFRSFGSSELLQMADIGSVGNLARLIEPS